MSKYVINMLSGTVLCTENDVSTFLRLPLVNYLHLPNAVLEIVIDLAVLVTC